MQGSELDVAKNIKTLELLKTELLNSLGGLFKNIFTGNTGGILHFLALLIVFSFLTAKRLGINFGQLELQIFDELKTIQEGNDGQLDEEDIKAFKSYLEMKR